MTDVARKQTAVLPATAIAPAAEPAETTWKWIRWSGYAVYVAVVATITATSGIPTGRTPVAILIVAGLVVTRIGKGWRRMAQVLVDWLPFTVVLLAYDRTRGVADSLGISVHVSDILDAEKWLFGGTEPTIWLQDHLYNPSHVYWYDALFTIIYTTHFLATPILAGILWLRDRRLWMFHISRVILLSVAGLITYIVFPEAPPWLAARDGLSRPVERLSPRGWDFFHAGNVNSLLTNAQSEGTNAVAAMPSLHIAFATLVAIVIATRIHSKWRWLLALYPVAMGFTLVYTGEHYVLDLVAGVAYAWGAHVALSRWEARRLARTSDPAPIAL